MNHPLPGVSYVQLKRIIIAYSMFPESTVTAAKLSEYLSGKISKNEIGRNSDFLCSIGLLQRAEKYGTYTTTQVCKSLGESIRKEPESEKEVSRIWNNIISNNTFFTTIKQRIEAAELHSGVMKISDLKNTIISLSEFKNVKSGHRIYDESALAVIHILKAAKLITSLDSKTVKIHKLNLPGKFISAEIIDQLKKIDFKKFNLSRLIYYCEQINDNYDWGYYESVTFVTRALMDHVPPIFGQPNFESIAPQTSNGKVPSFRKSCNRLSDTLRHIADDLIHSHVNEGTSLLVKEEIDFSQDLNTFLRRTLEELKKLQNQDK